MAKLFDSQVRSSPDSLPPVPHVQEAPLFNMHKLNIPHDHHKFFKAVNEAVRAYTSRDYAHIQRVVALTHRIYTAEVTSRTHSGLCTTRVQSENWAEKIDVSVLYLAAMLHCTGASVNPSGSEAEADAQAAVVARVLRDCRVHTPFARQVEYLVPRVSFLQARLEPEVGQTECEYYPALKVLQDAVWAEGLSVCCPMAKGVGGTEQLLRSMRTEAGREVVSRDRLWEVDFSSVI